MAVVEIASGPYLAACGLLVVTGVAKLRAPGPTTTAMHAILLPANNVLTRAVGTAELTLAAVGVLAAGRVAFAVAGAYLAFLGVAVRLRRRAPSTGCGCIGAHSATVGIAHLVTCASAIAVASVYGAGNGDGLVGVLREQPLAGVPFVALVVACVALVTIFMANPSEARPWQPS